MLSDEEFERRADEIRRRHVAIVPADIVFAVEAGWLDLIDFGLELIEGFLREHGCLENSRVVQIKEKFGELRVYVRPHGAFKWSDKVATGLARIRDEISSRSVRTCEICGEQGQIEIIGNYHQCLCSAHAAKRLQLVTEGRPARDWR